MDSSKIICELRKELKQNSDSKSISNYKRFFKEEVKFYGIKTAIVGKIGKKYFEKIKDQDKKYIFSLCEELLKSDYCEESFIAFAWSYNLRKQYQQSDFNIFEKWIKKYVNNWAKCDTFCNHTIGSFIEMFPQFIKNLKTWTKSENRWLRRASAVSLILSARRGLFLKDIFEISNSLLKDEDDLVQKGYGWLLKEASKAHQKEIFDYVMKNKKQMPRTSLRYAIEKLPENLRKKAMEK